MTEQLTHTVCSKCNKSGVNCCEFWEGRNDFCLQSGGKASWRRAHLRISRIPTGEWRGCFIGREKASFRGSDWSNSKQPARLIAGYMEQRRRMYWHRQAETLFRGKITNNWILEFPGLAKWTFQKHSLWTAMLLSVKTYCKNEVIIKVCFFFNSLIVSFNSISIAFIGQKCFKNKHFDIYILLKRSNRSQIQGLCPWDPQAHNELRNSSWTACLYSPHPGPSTEAAH